MGKHLQKGGDISDLSKKKGSTAAKSRRGRRFSYEVGKVSVKLKIFYARERAHRAIFHKEGGEGKKFRSPVAEEKDQVITSRRKKEGKRKGS